jgi:hypothetical protein
MPVLVGFTAVNINIRAFPPRRKMCRTLSLIFCVPKVIISGKICLDINIYSCYSSKNGHECLDDNILQLFKVSDFS